GDGLDICGCRSDSSAAGRGVDWSGDRGVYRGEVWFERNDDRGADYYDCGEGGSAEADWVLRADGAGDGGQASGAAVGRGYVWHRLSAGLLGGVRNGS